MYTTLDYYKNTYGGQIVSDTELTKYLNKAADDIDIATNYGFTFADLTSFQNELVQKANCAQAEEYVKNNGDLTDDFKSLSVGNFSISGGSTTKSNIVTSRANSFLLNAGLLYRGVECDQYLDLY